MKSSPALIIFDIDGTLLQAQLITTPALRRTFQDFGLAVPDEEAIQDLFGMPVEEYEAWLAAHAPGRAEAFVAAANKRELEMIREAGQLYPGVLETLTTLRDAGHVLATCSNGSVAYVDEALDAHGLRPFFEVVRCIGQGYGGKTAMIGDIMERIDARPAIVVGDRQGDVSGAQANGALSVAATYGFGAAQELEAADVAIASIRDLPGVIRTLLEDG